MHYFYILDDVATLKKNRRTYSKMQSAERTGYFQSPHGHL